jgi:hypothetical protein
MPASSRRQSSPRRGEALHRKVDGAADRGPPHKRPGCGEDRRGDDAGVLLVVDHRPIGDHQLLAGAGPFDEAYRDGAVGPAADRGEDARIGQGRGIALALQLELALVDAARHVGGEDEQQVRILGASAQA